MKVIEFREFGKINEYFELDWFCLTNPDANLKSYYNQVLNTPFNKKRFRRAGVFRNIGEIDGWVNSFNEFNGIRCLDMPIKMAGNKEYRIPNELIQFKEVISNMVAFENAHNDKVIDFYAYLTIDQNDMVREYHREPGLHVDGFQGARINPKVWCDRSYIVVNCDPTSFWNQSFETVENLDDSKYNIFHEFDRTKHYSAEIKCLPYNIYFMDCYAVHSANKLQNNKRTFCRLSYSVRQYDRLGNSHNNCFDYNWQMVNRDVAKNLI